MLKMNHLIGRKPLALAKLLMLALALSISTESTTNASSGQDTNSNNNDGTDSTNRQQDKVPVDKQIYALRASKPPQKLPLEELENYLKEKQIEKGQLQQNLDLPLESIENDLLELTNNVHKTEEQQRQLDRLESFKMQATLLKLLVGINQETCNFDQLRTILLPVAMGIGYSTEEKGILDSVAKPLLVNALVACQSFLESSFKQLAEATEKKQNSLDKLTLVDLMNMFQIQNGFATKQVNFRHWPKIFRTLNHGDPNGFLATTTINLQTIGDKLLLSRETFNKMYQRMHKMCQSHNEDGLGMYFKLSKAIRTYTPERSYVDDGQRKMPIQFKGKEILFRETMFRFALCRQILRLNKVKLDTIYSYIREGAPRKRCANQDNCQHRKSCICDQNDGTFDQIRKSDGLNSLKESLYDTKANAGAGDDDDDESDGDEEEEEEKKNDEGENKTR